MTWLIINWTKYLKIPAKFELRYPAVSAIPIPTMASYTTSFSIPGSPNSNQQGSGASLRALCLAAITESCLHVFVGNPQCWLSPFRAVSCHVILFLTLLGPMWLHIMLLPFKNQKRTKKNFVSSQFPRSPFQTFPSSRLHLTLITLLRKFQLIKENDLNFSFPQLQVSPPYLQTFSSPAFFEKNGFSLLSKLITPYVLFHSLQALRKQSLRSYLYDRLIWISVILKNIRMVKCLFSM